MSALGEETPTNPQDPLHYAPRRAGQRPDLRLSTVSSTVGETPFDRPSKPELVHRAPRPPSSLNPELENAVFRSLRRQMDPEVVPEPPAIEGRWRRAWIGVAAAVAVAAMAATAFVTLTPRDEAGAPSAATSSAEDDTTKPALAQFRPLLVAKDGDQAVSPDQSQRLLQQFMQWRQKTEAGDQAR
jgi:hypothetical protein